METTNNTQHAEAFTRLATETGTLIIDSFNKQFEISFEFYRNLLSTWKENKTGQQTNPFFPSVFSNPFLNERTNEIYSSFITQFKKEIQLANEKSLELNEKLNKTAEESRKTSQAVINAATDNFFRQLNYFIELNKKLTEDGSKYLSTLSKQNENSLAELLKTKENSNGSEKDVRVENKFVQVKKQPLNS